jgi:hypothetical protein
MGRCTGEMLFLEQGEEKKKKGTRRRKDYVLLAYQMDDQPKQQLSLTGP